MHPPTTLLYVILIVQVYTALAATKSARSLQETEDLKKRSKIGAAFYPERDCKEDFSMADDLTMLAQEHVSNGNWFISNAPINSFQLLDRSLEGQEQLDISAMTPSTGDKCGVFIGSYFADTTTDCNNVNNIACVRLWNNAGLWTKNVVILEGFFR